MNCWALGYLVILAPSVSYGLCTCSKSMLLLLCHVDVKFMLSVVSSDTLVVQCVSCFAALIACSTLSAHLALLLYMPDNAVVAAYPH